MVSLFAAVDHNDRVVWGIGKSASLALSDARCEIAKKPLFASSENRLELAKLDSKVDLDLDGASLYPYCTALDDGSSKQIDLF